MISQLVFKVKRTWVIAGSVLTTIFIFCSNGLAQIYPTMTSKESYLFMHKLQGWRSDVPINTYAYTFDNINYQNAQSDEFEKREYDKRIIAELQEGIKNVDFTKKYSITSTGRLSPYDFESGGFKMSSWDWKNSHRFFSGPNNPIGLHHRFTLGDIYNIGYFNARVSMHSEDANAFVKSRKLGNGEVDRTVYLRATYSVMNKKIPSKNNVFKYKVYFYSIEVFADADLTDKLATLEPTVDFYDKVNGVAKKDFFNTIYLDENWRQVEESKAAYYQRVLYRNGRISNPVTGHYMTGQVYCQVSYKDYYPDYEHLNGLATTFHKNGQIASQIEFVDGKRNGTLEQWHSNGVPMRLVNFDDDEKRGCEYEWDESGKCKTGKYARPDHGQYHRISDDASSDMFSGKCPCSEAPIPTPYILTFSDIIVHNSSTTTQLILPTIDIIKAHLRGHHVEGWKFDLSGKQFKQIEIVASVHEGPRAKFWIHCTLEEQASNTEREYDLHLEFLSRVNDNGRAYWSYISAEMLSVTYVNPAPVEKWKDVRPLVGYDLEIIDNGQAYWIKNKNNRKAYKGGPGGEDFKQRYAIIQISSRETHPVNLSFKYTSSKMGEWARYKRKNNVQSEKGFERKNEVHEIPIINKPLEASRITEQLENDITEPQSDINIIEFDNGDVYEGDISNGMRHGNGRIVYRDGTSFEGEWVNDKIGAKGIYIDAKANKYTGDFLNGQRTGRGTLTGSLTGDVTGFWKYEGNFRDGEVHGYAVFNLESSDGVKIYREGQWNNGELNGQGTMRTEYSKQVSIYKGEFLNGKLHNGTREITTLVDGAKFISKFQNGIEGKIKKLKKKK